jgi:uncharacterized protein
MPNTSPSPGPLELLVVQPTPFCNINCTYCYLPDRQSTKRMSLETLEQTFRWVFSSGLVREEFTLLWHAGEPLVVPVDFYEAAVDLLDQYNRQGVTVHHTFQTNATLLDADWCEFIRRHDVCLGVSVDGPAFLHDRHRQTRQGHGTLDRVLRGIHLLHEYQIPFHSLSVLTADALDYPDELFDFFQTHQIRTVGFNVEEIEGPNTSSSLEQPEFKERFRRFFTRFVDLALSADPPLEVREFETSAGALLGARYEKGSRTQENKPWAILNVDCDGNFSTYSPELLGITSMRYGSFALGNVARDRLDDVVASERFQALEADIALGVDRCRESCSYFPFCGGSAPANKYFENGTFASTETLSCRLQKMVCLDVTLSWLERHEPCDAPAASELASSERARV